MQSQKVVEEIRDKALRLYFLILGSFSIKEKLNVPYFGTIRLYLCINKTDKPLKFNSYEYR